MPSSKAGNISIIPPGFDSLLITRLTNVRYLTGFTGSSGCAIITQRGRRIFFTDFRYRDQAAREVKGFEVEIVPGAALAGACAAVARRRLKLGITGFEAAYLSHQEYLMVRKLLKGTGARLREAGGSVEAQREVKSGKEISRIKKACAIADHAMRKLCRTKVTGRSELEVAWLLEATMRQAGSGPLPFEVIVASGPRSAMPHGAPTTRMIGPAELVVVDLGASVDGYCSDMTRTFATGHLSARQEKIYRVVSEAQELAFSQAAAGVSCAELDALARGHITEAGFGEAFGHSLGHGVGLEAHEGPVLAPRSAEILAAGMTVTIEPGIYLPRTGGVRIEDTVLVGARKARRLTCFPRDLTLLR